MLMRSKADDLRRDRASTLLSKQRSRYTLDQEFYRDPEIFDLEMEILIEQKWHFVALASEVPEVGQFITVSIGRSSVIICRNRDGHLKAHHNSCRHRGSQICDATNGRRSTLVCPYHHWSYDLDGNLIRAPNMPDDFDRADHGLKSVHLRNVAGLIFICISDNPPDFTAFSAALTPAIVPHRLEDTHVVKEIVLDEKANWKLVWENARECDHCNSGHPELMKTLQLFNMEDPWSDPYISAFWQRCENSGLPSQTKDGHGFRVGRVPLQPGQLSITDDGTPACGKRLGNWPDQDIGSLRWAMFPSVFSHVHADYAIFAHIMPLGPELTRVTCKWVVHKDAVEGKDYDLDRLVEIWGKTNIQDKEFCERNQLGVNSRGYQPGPHSPSEYGLWVFLDWYRAEMERALE